MRSFGTEDRPTDKPVPPRDEVYEYIIFRGSDIKDLHVCEPPKQQVPMPHSSLPQDPAIVKVRYHHMWLLSREQFRIHVSVLSADTVISRINSNGGVTFIFRIT